MSDQHTNRIKILEEKVRLLEIENKDWTDRAEDVFLFATTSETIHNMDSEMDIFDAVLEKISVLKGLSYCAFGKINNNRIDLFAEYASFSNEDQIAKISCDEMLIESLKRKKTVIGLFKNGIKSLNVSFKETSFVPVSYIIISTNNLNNKNIVFVAFDSGPPEHLKSIRVTIEHVIMLTNSKLDNLHLMDQLENQNKILEEKVSKRTIALQKSEEMYRQLIEQSNDAIYLMLNDSFEIINPKFTEIFGFTIEEINNKSFDIKKLFSEKSWPMLEKRISKLKRGEKVSQIYEFKAITKSGVEVDCEVSTSYIDYKNGIAAQGVIRDITEKKKMIEQLIVAKEEAEKADKIKSEFLAQVSHEIRTPINTILSFASLIKDKHKNTNDDEVSESIRYMSSASRRIIRTIDLIVNMSEIQTGTLDYKPKQTDLKKEIIDSLILEYKYLALEKNIGFDISLLTSKTKIMADEYSVGQIFHNLIDNAIKFTGRGNVIIIIERDERDRLCVSVKDTGIGIAKKFIPNLFKSFTQEEQGYTRRYEGNGLGLALVKKYCDLNKASIDVKSKKGVGTTFKVTFNDRS